MGNNKLKKLPTAVVLGLGITGLGASRNLGRNGIYVIGLDPVRYTLGHFSRYCRHIVTPNIENSEEKFLDFLVQIGKKMTPPGVLFPTEDKYVLFVNRNRGILQNCFRFILPEKSLCEKILNKYKFFELATQNAFPVPQTFFVKTSGELKNVSKKIKFPCMIKPLYSKKWSLGSLVKAIKLDSRKELLKKYWNLEKDCKVIIQEIVTGKDYEQFSYSAYFNLQGRYVAGFVARKIRQSPLEFGVGTLIESANNGTVAELGKRIVKQLRIKGIAEVEFRKSDSDGKLKLIEINLRPWTQSTLAACCGLNLIYLTYLDLIGESIPNNISYRVGVKWVNIFRDTISSIQYILRGDLSLNEWGKSFIGARDFAVFAFDDILPFLCFPLHIIAYFNQSRKKDA